MKDHFKEKSQTWDEEQIRVMGAKKIANAITEKIDIHPTMEIMDFGVGTGLLGFEIAKIAKKVYGVDTSKSMIEKLKEKNNAELHIETFCQDIIQEPLNKTFDGVISSMTLHHIENLKDFFETIHTNIAENGFLAIADLELEDGTFHSDNTGVFHFGFDTKELCEVVLACGFKNVQCTNIDTINKPERDFGIFLLSARK